jgi:CO/xanthine dehydrogenase Mo-binding subunit
MEQVIRDVNGKILNDGFLDYKIPNIGDVPEIEAICIESLGTNGPFGAKGIGEPGLVPTAPAIANAIYDATGVWLRELPMTPERVLRALEEAKKST